MAEERESETEYRQISTLSEDAREETDLSLALLSRENTSSTISIVRPKFNIKSKSSLKSVLTEYGLPDDEIVKLKEGKRKKKQQTTLMEDIQEQAGPRKSKSESYLKVYRDTYKSKDVVCEDVMEKLTDKVDRQRKMIQRRSEQLEKNRLEREEQERLKRSQKKKSRVELHHDDTFMKELPKSKFYKLISIEDRLKAKGILKFQIDIEDFWRSVRDPEVLERYMKCALSGTDLGTSEGQQVQQSKSLSSASASSFGSASQKVEKENMDHNRPLTQISEGQEASRPVTRDDRPNTRSPHSHRKSPVKRKDPHAIARAAAQELEKKYPMVELPPLACYNLELGEQPPDPEQVLQEMDATKREKERMLFIKRIRKMYNLAQSNSATTHRILEKHGDEFDMWYDGGSPVTSMMPPVEQPKKFPPLQAIQYESQQDDILERRPWLKHLRHREILPIEELPEESSNVNVKNRKPKKKSAKRRDDADSERSSSSKQQQRKPDPHPDLCLDSLQEHSKVVDAKCLTTFWPNYTGGCKSVFAK